MKSGAAAHYSVMSLEQLKALDVAALCEKDCVLVMWYVSSQPQEALDLVKAWGFTLKKHECLYLAQAPIHQSDPALRHGLLDTGRCRAR